MKEFKEVFTAQDWKDLDEFEMERAYWANKAKQKPCDTLTQHSWPEEKPTETNDYLVNIPGRKNGEKAVMYYSVEWGEWGFRDGNTLIASTQEPNYWWDLPKVRE